MTPTPKGLISLTALAAIALPCAASAQSYGSGGAAQFQAGYGAARYTTARPVTGSTRDANGNRLVVDGLIQTGASSYSSSSGGVATAYSGAGGQNNGQTQIGGATAVGNSLNVVIQGNNNTVIVNSNQTNTGNVTAGTALNGTLRLQ